MPSSPLPLYARTRTRTEAIGIISVQYLALLQSMDKCFIAHCSCIAWPHRPPSAAKQVPTIVAPYGQRRPTHANKPLSPKWAPSGPPASAVEACGEASGTRRLLGDAPSAAAANAWRSASLASRRHRRRALLGEPRRPQAGPAIGLPGRRQSVGPVRQRAMGVLDEGEGGKGQARRLEVVQVRPGRRPPRPAEPPGLHPKARTVAPS